MYLFAQILGVVASGIAIFAIQMKKGWQILLLTMFANLFSVVVFLLLNGFSSAVTVSVIAAVQCGINAYLSYNGKEVSVVQKTIFTTLFLINGVVSYTVLLDILPIAASLIFAWSTFQKEEQQIRLFFLLNALLWIVYDAIIGTTAVIGQLFSLVSILVAIYRYRKPKKSE